MRNIRNMRGMSKRSEDPALYFVEAAGRNMRDMSKRSEYFDRLSTRIPPSRSDAAGRDMSDIKYW